MDTQKWTGGGGNSLQKSFQPQTLSHIFTHTHTHLNGICRQNVKINANDLVKSTQIITKTLS